MSGWFPVLLFSLSFFSSPTHAQTPYRWEIGGGVGVSSYQGDLDKFLANVAQRQVNPAISLHMRRYLNNVFSLRAGVLGGRLAGDETHFTSPEWRRERGISFHSMIWEAKLGIEFYPVGQYVEHFIDDPLSPAPAYDAIRNYRLRPNGDTLISHARRRKFAPYLFLGTGAVYTRPHIDWNEAGDGGNAAVYYNDLKTDQNARYRRINPLAAVGGGVRIPLSKKTLLGLEGLFHYAFSDYLDGVSAVGNPAKKDWYFIGQVSLSWPLGKSDQDRDGLTDQDDRCPNVPGVGLAGGCPDTDLDGVADHHDRCPGVAGSTLLGGCPDADADGIADVDDLCPKIPGKGTMNGCPATSMPFLNAPFKVVYFDPAADQWLPTSQIILEEAAYFLQNNPGYFARIEGNADLSTDEANNKAISEVRAQRCRDYLAGKGLDASRLTFTGLGDKRPMASNDIAEGRRLNNRVEIYFFQK